MRVVFRVDASQYIGAGHTMRCLTLADELRRRGHTCSFICRSGPGDLIDLIRQRGHSVHALPELLGAEPKPSVTSSAGIPPHAHWLACDALQDAQDSLTCLGGEMADWLVVDHYAIDARWELCMRAGAHRIAVIDDLADRPHRCELLLDQNLYAEPTERYKGLVPETCRLLLGPRHVLLRPEFVNARLGLQRTFEQVRHILVFFGTDHTLQTQKVIEAVRHLVLRDVGVDVVAAVDPEQFETLRLLSTDLPNVRLHSRVSNMAELVARADLGVGAGGSAMWERCYLGLPTLTVTFADNQLRTTEAAARLGAIRYLGPCEEFTYQDYAHALGAALAAPENLEALSRISFELVECGTVKMAEAMQALMGLQT